MKPLADRLRPQSLDEVVGQTHLVGKNGIIRKIASSGNIPNMVFYGPPGVGKTTVASILAKMTDKKLFKLNGTSAGRGDIKDIIAELDTFMAPDGVLLYLLFLIKKGQVFTPKTVSSLKYISLLVMAVGVLFVLLTPYFRMACAVGFLIVFVGVVILVVKNVLEEAVKIKNENDFTI